MFATVENAFLEENLQVLYKWEEEGGRKLGGKPGIKK